MHCIDVAELVPANHILRALPAERSLLATFHACLGEELTGHLQRIRDAYGQDRETLVTHLLAWHKRKGAAQPALNNITQLRQPDTLVVIGGQQAGLLTGPAYTIHKAISLLKLAQELSAQTPFTFVPMFWTASEDHDLAEVDHTYIFSPDGNEVERLSYPIAEAYRGRSIGHIPLGEDWKAFLRHLQTRLTPTGFTENLFKLLQEAAEEAESYADWFNLLMVKLFSPHGLIVVDPLDRELKQLVRPLLAQAIDEPLAVSYLVNRAGDRLEEQGWKRQIHKVESSCPFFLQEEERRVPVRFQQGEYRTPNRSYTRADLQAILQAAPERFSPNATLRPVMADFLFPTGAFVGGPGEMGYLAQLPEVYHHFQVPMPVIFPRIGYTYILPKVGKILAKYHLSPLDVREEHQVFTQISRRRYQVAEEAYWEQLRAAVQQPFHHLRTAVPEIDPTLVGAVDSTVHYLLDRINKLEQKLLRNVRQKEEIIHQQIRHAHFHLFPRNRLQERSINIFYYLNIFGFSLVSDLLAQCSIGHTRHCFVRLL